MNHQEIQNFSNTLRALTSSIGASSLSIHLFEATTIGGIDVGEHFSVWATINGVNGKVEKSFNANISNDGELSLKEFQDLKRQIMEHKNKKVNMVANDGR